MAFSKYNEDPSLKHLNELGLYLKMDALTVLKN